MKITLFVTLLISCSLIGHSQVNPGKVGQKAPPINIENWIYPKIQVAGWQNKEVPKDLKGKIIVLDFWFTKCAPCVASIPELILGKKYGLIIKMENQKTKFWEIIK